MIAALLLLTAAQALPAPAAAPQRHSVLAPACPASTPEEVVVCARADDQRLPLPGERGPPDGPRRPTGDPRAALDAGDPGACALRGCQTGTDIAGMGVAAIRLVGKLIDPDSCCDRPGQGTDLFQLAGDTARGIRRALAGKPDKSRRVAIALDVVPPTTAGRLLP